VTLDDYEAFCLSLPASTLSVQWGGTHVYKVGGKMFAMHGGEAAAPTFKASDMAFELLQETGVGVAAPYMQRAKWIKLVSEDALSNEDLRAYLRQAHALIAARLTRKARQELGLSPP